jgi:hypothetical protein
VSFVRFSCFISCHWKPDPPHAERSAHALRGALVWTPLTLNNERGAQPSTILTIFGTFVSHSKLPLVRTSRPRRSRCPRLLGTAHPQRAPRSPGIISDSLIWFLTAVTGETTGSCLPPHAERSALHYASWRPHPWAPLTLNRRDPARPRHDADRFTCANHERSATETILAVALALARYAFGAPRPERRSPSTTRPRIERPGKACSRRRAGECVRRFSLESERSAKTGRCLTGSSHAGGRGSWLTPPILHSYHQDPRPINVDV